MAANRASAPAPRSHPQTRRWPRYHVDIPLRVVTQRATKNVIIHGHGTELNGGGMRVFAIVDLSVGDQVALEFTPPYSGRLVRVRGFVRNRAGHSYGIEFITENDADYHAVNQLESVLGQMSSPLP